MLQGVEEGDGVGGRLFRAGGGVGPDHEGCVPGQQRLVVAHPDDAAVEDGLQEGLAGVFDQLAQGLRQRSVRASQEVGADLGRDQPWWQRESVADAVSVCGDALEFGCVGPDVPDPVHPAAARCGRAEVAWDEGAQELGAVSVVEAEPVAEARGQLLWEVGFVDDSAVGDVTARPTACAASPTWMVAPAGTGVSAVTGCPSW
nr:hypothetical protein [Streptomyces roseochromogenus]